MPGTPDPLLRWFLLRRFATLLLTLGVASVIVFAVLELLPGSAAQVVLGDTATPEALAALEARMGLDRPALQRYADWVGGLLRGQTALSLAYDTPTAELIAERLQVTLPLALLAMALTTAVALAAGVYAAARQNRLGDLAVMTLSQAGMALPNFWLAILLILLFAVKLAWLPAGGFPGWSEEDGGGLGPGLQALLLPALALAAVQAAILARVTRSAVLEVLREDFVRTARAKGLAERVVVAKHALRNALVPVVTLGALELGTLLSGAVLTEQVFTIPGFGKLVVDAVFNRDYPVVQGVVLVVAVIYVGLNLAADVLYVLINPRLRHA